MKFDLTKTLSWLATDRVGTHRPAIHFKYSALPGFFQADRWVCDLRVSGQLVHCLDYQPGNGCCRLRTRRVCI